MLTQYLLKTEGQIYLIKGVFFIFSNVNFKVIVKHVDRQLSHVKQPNPYSRLFIICIAGPNPYSRLFIICKAGTQIWAS
uniref:Uncharacterized protein n=1 Tax=Arundo donax TaxID=35708 RepID=A0A0A9A541_ARUDO